MKIIVLRTNVWYNVFGTFNSWVIAELSKEGRRYNEQERFFNLCFSNSYLPISNITIYSFNLKRKSPNSVLN